MSHVGHSGHFLQDMQLFWRFSRLVGDFDDYKWQLQVMTHFMWRRWPFWQLNDDWLTTKSTSHHHLTAPCPQKITPWWLQVIKRGHTDAINSSKDNMLKTPCFQKTTRWQPNFTKNLRPIDDSRTMQWVLQLHLHGTTISSSLTKHYNQST